MEVRRRLGEVDLSEDRQPLHWTQLVGIPFLARPEKEGLTSQ